MHMRKTKYERAREFLTATLGPHIGPKVAALLRGVYLAGQPLKTIPRRLKTNLVDLQIFYECRVAPFLATKLPWVLWPAYRLLAALNVCFVINIADGVGHIISELDNFFRMLHLGEIDRNKRCVWVRKSIHLSRACVDLYGRKFWWAISNDLIYALLLPITIRYKDITVDCGLSRMKWQLTDNREYYPPMPGESYLHRISKSEARTQWADYHKRRLKCSDYFPLKGATPDDEDLIRFLNGDAEKLALIHIRTGVVNATAKPTDPETYLEALEYLVDLGYRLIFVGREKMPEVFRRYQAINYSESNVASFKNDIQLFNLADMAITAGSGISYLADCYDKPYLYLNAWHLDQVTFSRKCIFVPTLVREVSGEFLKFSEQIELYYSLPDVGPEVFPETQYQARNATTDEILAAAQEMISLRENYQERSSLQEQFRQLDSDGLLRCSEARCSEYFLKKHSDLF